MNARPKVAGSWAPRCKGRCEGCGNLGTECSVYSGNLGTECSVYSGNLGTECKALRVRAHGRRVALDGWGLLFERVSRQSGDAVNGLQPIARFQDQRVDLLFQSWVKPDWKGREAGLGFACAVSLSKMETSRG